MADFSALKQSIETYIKNNGNKEITGAILQNILLSMVTTMGDGAINDNASDISDIKSDIQNINGDITDINGDISDINGSITDINGDITDLNGDLTDEVNRAKGAETTTILFSDGKLVFKNAAGTVLYQLSVDSFLSAITTRLNTGALYAGYATPSTTPAALTSQEVFYLATQAGTYTNFHFNGGDDPIILTKDGIYFIVSGTDDDDWNAEPMLQLDDVPTASSNNAVKSGGVAEELALGAVYDVSAKNPTAGPNNDGKWVSLSALLSDANLNTLIPTSVRKGGMSIKFIQSSDNKYVQYRLMSDTFNTTPANWQGVDDEPTAGSDNLVESKGIYDSAVKPLIPTLYIPTHTLISGKFIGSDGIEGSSDIVNRTSSIHLNAGDRLSVKAKASGLISVISIDNGDNTFTPKVLGKSWENYNYYNYIAEEDCNVTISYEYKNGANQYYITIIPEFYRRDKELVSIINPVAICPSYSIISGKFIGADNLEGSQASYSRTSPIHLNKGNRVFVKAKVPGIVGVIATVNSDNTFSSVVLGKTWENYAFYAYTAERDCDVTISYLSNYGQDGVDISIIPCFENTKENIKDNLVFEREPADWEVKYGYYNKNTDEFFVASDDRTFISYLHKVNAGERCHIFGNAFVPSVAAQVVYYADKEMTTVIGKETTSTEGTYDIYVTIPEGTNYVLVYFTLTLRLIGDNNVINCIGNSLTEGQNGLTNPVDDTVSPYNSYTNELKEYLPDFKIMNYGYGGNNPSSIFCCAGLADMIINMDFVLKAYPNESLVSDNSQSSLHDSLINKAVSYFLLQGVNPESNIARIFGNYHGNPITLRRRSAGENAVVVGMAAEGTIGDVNFKSGDSIQLRGVENRDGISIIFCGHNDLTWYDDTQLCVDTYKKIVENLNNNKYLILGMCTSDASQLQAIQTTNEALRREFGNHFIDMTRWLCSETSFAEMNYTITEDSDISAERQAAGVYSDRYGINNNLIPSSFWRYSKTTSNSAIDNVHLNKLGYKALAYAVFKRLSYLKWV